MSAQVLESVINIIEERESYYVVLGNRVISREPFIVTPHAWYLRKDLGIRIVLPFTKKEI